MATMSNRSLLGKLILIGAPDGFFTVKTRCTTESTFAVSDAGRSVVGRTITGGVGVGAFGSVGGTLHVVSQPATDVSWCVPATACAFIEIVCTPTVPFAPMNADGSALASNFTVMSASTQVEL